MEKILKIILAFVFVMLVSACVAGTEVAPTVFDITYESNGGTDVANMSAVEGRSFLEPTQPTRVGYSFNGWYSDSTLNNAYNFTYSVSGDINLYADWITNEYTVTFESNGGSDVESISFDYDTAVDEPTAPEMEHYTFLGWYEDI